MRLASAVIVLAAALVAAACSSGAARTGGRAGTTTLQIVAGENFWGSIVAQLAGKAGSVTSIVSDPNADPHDYESSAADARAFAGADYVVLNGAGYDTWAQKLLSGNPNPTRAVLTVADLLGKKAGDNPHFWYDPAYVGQVIDRVEADLERLDPTATAYFQGQRAALDAAMQPSRSRLADIKATSAGRPVASTESIFVYLALDLGLDLISPPEFMKAVSEGTDPPAASVAEFQTQLTSKQADVLVYNTQTATAVTTNLTHLATKAGIPTVGITETVEPRNATFEQWFEAELGALQHALSAKGAAG
jgi:zinc/manganese transport system substrate-binding protein